MSHKILYVDDEEELRSMVGEYLKLMGNEFWPAASAEESLRIANETALDVIILDLNLGGQSGAGLMSLLRQKQPKAPIILYTGLEADDDTVKEMLARETNARYLRKDGSLEALVHAVESALA